MIKIYWTEMLAVAAITASVMICNDDYQEEQHQADHYQEMVCSGAWPDFKQLNPECPGND